MNYHCDLAVSITIGEFATRHHHHTQLHRRNGPGLSIDKDLQTDKR